MPCLIRFSIVPLKGSRQYGNNEAILKDRRVVLEGQEGIYDSLSTEPESHE